MILYKRGSRGAVVKQIQKALNLYPDGVFGPITEEAVIKFQQAHGITADGIVGAKTLALLIPHRLKKSKRRITEIIVHCTATPEGKDFTVEQIRQWHLARGFADIGYHYVIYRDGSIHDGRDVDLTGAHTTGHNTNSIGISYVGGCGKDGKTPKDTRTEEQKATMLGLLLDLRRLYPGAKIYGHRDFANKACPSFDAKKEYSRI